MTSRNEPSFPVQYIDPNGTASNLFLGMTLRDWFAGQALVGLMYRHDVPGYNDIDATTEAYRIADAMLDQREKEPTS